ncbi:MAG: sulfotransferase family protein [Candidatus Puniceispirillaceae bacterium]
MVKENRYLICLGLPKFGTTFLQRLLDLHPEISCPSEINLTHTIDRVVQLLHDFDTDTEMMDRRTGGQGTTPVFDKVFPRLIHVALSSIVDARAKGAAVIGVSDNSLLRRHQHNLDRLEILHAVFDGPKYLALVRNPLDSAMSAIRHNKRLAEAEADDAHLEVISKAGGEKAFAKLYARHFAEYVLNIDRLISEGKDVLTVRYEDLVTDKTATTNQILRWLGVGHDAEVVAHLVENSSIDRMRKLSSQPSFFGAGSVNFAGAWADETLLEEIGAIAGQALARCRYNLGRG